MASIVIDLNDIVPPKTPIAAAREKVSAWDFSACSGAAVILKGCGPTWAFLMVAAKVLPLAQSLAFLMDDGKGGQPIPVSF